MKVPLLVPKVSSRQRFPHELEIAPEAPGSRLLQASAGTYIFFTCKSPLCASEKPPFGFPNPLFYNVLAVEAQAAPFLLCRPAMEDRTTLPHPTPDGRRLGFTMVELVLTLTIIAIMVAMAIPKISGTMQASRVNRTTAIVAADMEHAFTLAGRFRRPMRISCACGTGVYTVADLAGGTVRLRRTLVGDSDIGNMTVAFNPPVAGIVDVYPSGVSTTPLTIRITLGASTRAVTVSTAGHVRIIP
jgi:prepilin-type N-terminal cleavage/methylation domain-containing protein